MWLHAWCQLPWCIISIAVPPAVTVTSWHWWPLCTSDSCFPIWGIILWGNIPSGHTAASATYIMHVLFCIVSLKRPPQRWFFLNTSHKIEVFGFFNRRLTVWRDHKDASLSWRSHAAPLRLSFFFFSHSDPDPNYSSSRLSFASRVPRWVDGRWRACGGRIVALQGFDVSKGAGTSGVLLS